MSGRGLRPHRPGPPFSRSNHEETVQRCGLLAFRQVHPGAEGFARGLRTPRSARRIRDRDHRRGRQLHCGAGHRLSGDGERGGTAVRAAPRGAEGVHPRPRPPHARVGGIPGQPAVHHGGQPGRERPRAPLPHELRDAHPGEALGARPDRGERSPRRAPHAGGISGGAGARAAVHGRSLGRELPAAHPAEARQRGRRGDTRAAPAAPRGARGGERPASRLPFSTAC